MRCLSTRLLDDDLHHCREKLLVSLRENKENKENSENSERTQRELRENSERTDENATQGEEKTQEVPRKLSTSTSTSTSTSKHATNNRRGIIFGDTPPRAQNAGPYGRCEMNGGTAHLIPPTPN